MTYRHIQVDPFSPVIGAEVSGVELGAPLDVAVSKSYTTR